MTDQYDITITAMCMWEETIGPLSNNPEVQIVFEQQGTCEVRDMILSHATQCHDDWERAQAAGYDDCFDWDWVPKWMRDNLTWTPQSINYTPSTPPLHMYLGEAA